MPLIRRCAMVPPFRALSCRFSGHFNRRDQRAAPLGFWWPDAWRSPGYLMEMVAGRAYSVTMNVWVRQTFNLPQGIGLVMAESAIVVAAQIGRDVAFFQLHDEVVAEQGVGCGPAPAARAALAAPGVHRRGALFAEVVEEVPGGLGRD